MCASQKVQTLRLPNPSGPVTPFSCILLVFLSMISPLSAWTWAKHPTSAQYSKKELNFEIFYKIYENF